MNKSTLWMVAGVSLGLMVGMQAWMMPAPQATSNGLPVKAAPRPETAARVKPKAPAPAVQVERSVAEATRTEPAATRAEPEATDMADRTLQALRMHQALLDIRSEQFDPEDPADQQDQVLSDTLKRKKAQHKQVVEALESLLDGVSDDERIDLLMLLGEAHADLASFIEGNPTPSYLTGAQAEFYEGRIAEKSMRIWERAHDRYVDALELAPEGSPERAAIEAELDRIVL